MIMRAGVCASLDIAMLDREGRCFPRRWPPKRPSRLWRIVKVAGWLVPGRRRNLRRALLVEVPNADTTCR